MGKMYVPAIGYLYHVVNRKQGTTFLAEIISQVLPILNALIQKPVLMETMWSIE